MDSIIEKAQAGSIRAFEKLVRKYDRQILSLAYQFSQNTEDAEDICQEVFMQAFKNIKSFNRRSSFFTWLYRIAVNYSLTYCSTRKHSDHQSLNEGEDGFVYEPVDFRLPDG